jgi:GNAT superfamily N-acetyltransferase
MSSSFELRPATAADAAAIAPLLTELGYPTAAADVPARLERTVADGGAVLIAIDGDTPLGVIALTSYQVLHAPGPVGYITALVTAPAARGRGVGRAMVDAAKAWAEARGCVRLAVGSAEHRADAHAFYPRCGMPYSGRRFATALPARP